MQDMHGVALWAARMALTSGGGWLAARGYGDAELWQSLAGAIMGVGGAAWSFFARRRQLAAAPR